MPDTWGGGDNFHDMHGNSPLLYGRHELWLGTEVTTTFNLSCQVGDLHGGRQIAGNSIASAAAYAPATGVPEEADVVAFAARLGRFTNGQAALVPQIVSTGLPAYDDFTAVGVIAKLTPGSDDNTSALREFDTLPSCYAFVHLRDATRELLALFKIVGGVITILDFVGLAAVDTAVGTYPTGEDRYDPRLMRIDCRDIGGGTSVDIVCWRLARNPSAGGSGEPAFVEIDVFGTVNDASAPLTGEGAPGFILTGARTNALGYDVAIGARGFEVRDIDTGTGDETVIFTDTFARAVPKAQREVTDESGVTGRVLMQAWTGDYVGRANGGAEAFAIGGILRSKGANEICQLGTEPDTVFTPANASLGYCARQFVEPSYDQRCGITINFPAFAPVAPREAGMFVRGSFPEFGATGEVLMLTEDTNGDPFNRGRTLYEIAVVETFGAPNTYALELRRVWENRITTLYESVLLATAPAPTVVEGTEFALEIECRNVTTQSGTPALPVSFRIWIDAVLITAWTVQQTYVTHVATTAVVNEASSSSIIDGPALGFYARMGGQHWIPSGSVIFDTFIRSDIAPSGGGGGVNDSEVRPSLPVPGEDDGKFGELDVPASWPITESTRYEPHRYPADTGHEMVGARNSTDRRRFRIVARGVSTARRRELEQFWRDHDGPATPFTFRHPRTRNAITARFIGNQLFHRIRSARSNAPSTEEYVFDVEEVYPPDLYNPPLGSGTRNELDYGFMDSKSGLPLRYGTLGEPDENGSEAVDLGEIPV